MKDVVILTLSVAEGEEPPHFAFVLVVLFGNASSQLRRINSNEARLQFWLWQRAFISITP
jgi:hypothetical protein